MLITFYKKSYIFYEKDGIKVIWREIDRKNLLKQHHEHEEYNDIKGIEECLKNPDRINISRNKNPRTLIYYKDRGNFFTKWHQVVIRTCKKWNDKDIDNKNKYAILITTQYLNSININEEQIWP